MYVDFLLTIRSIYFLKIKTADNTFATIMSDNGTGARGNIKSVIIPYGEIESLVNKDGLLSQMQDNVSCIPGNT